MTKVKGQRLRGSSGAAIALLSLLLILSAGCEREPSQIDRNERSEIAVPNQLTASELESRAVASRVAGNHQACAASFALSAKATVSTADSGQRWYEASRCAARAGDYRQSIFHLHAAASGGFASADEVRSEPLFRPLHSGSRWRLTLDLIGANEESMPPKLAPVPQQEEESAAPCALLDGLLEELLLST